MHHTHLLLRSAVTRRKNAQRLGSIGRSSVFASSVIIGVNTVGYSVRASSSFFYSWHNRSKQDRQCTYNVTLRRVRATIVAVEKQ